MWLEVFLVAGERDSEIKKIASYARRIKPDMVQLNTVARIPAERDVKPFDAGRLEQIRSLFDVPAESVTPFKSRDSSSTSPESNIDNRIIDLLRRRSSTLSDIEQGLGIGRSDARRALRRLVNVSKVIEHCHDSETVYRLRR
jgi:wyosine [tRNA(Phe)-imidazoG37] synthetase (radical SAM superfamily)